ncbi:diphosphomevalonate decarboxylase [soil metagenome]
MSKVTVQSPANIAFIKYWGKQPGEEYIPLNNNISMTLSHCQTITTILRDSNLTQDTVKMQKNDIWQSVPKDTTKNKKIYEQIDRIRNMSKYTEHVHIRTRNTFPSDAGIASSASGFSALTTALHLAFELPSLVDDKKELSRQIRLCGSASAARSAMGGFVELIAGADDKSSICEQIVDENYWELVDIIAVVDAEKKKTTTSEGHDLAGSSPYFETRLKEMQPRIHGARAAILARDLAKLGPIIEADTISMHTVMMTSAPPIYYWQVGTMAVMHAVRQWREAGLESYFSIDAGANVHIIAEKKNASELESRLKQISFVQSTIYNEPCAGVHEISEHLF